MDTAIEALAGQLDDEDVEVRLAGVFALGSIMERYEVSLTHIERAFRDPDESIRRFALSAMYRVGPACAEIEASVLSLLSDTAPEVRAAAVDALDHVDASRLALLPVLLQRLRDPDERVRVRALWGIIHRRDEAGAATSEVMRLLEDPSESVRLTALTALAWMRAEPSDTVPLVVRALDGLEVDGPWFLIRAAGCFREGVEQLVPALRRLLARRVHPSETALALKNLAPGDDSWSSSVLADFRTATGSDRYGLLHALCDSKRRDPETLTEALRAIGDPEFMLRGAGARLLGQMGRLAEPHLELMLPLLKERDTFVGHYATFALIQLSEEVPAVLPLLDAVFEERPNRDSVHAAQAQFRRGRVTDAAVRAVLAMLGRGEAPERKSAAAALRDLDKPDSQVIEALRATLVDPVWEVRLAASVSLTRHDVRDNRALAVLVQELRTGDEHGRSHVLWALGNLKSTTDEVAAAVESALEDSDDDVRVRAAIMLKGWGRRPEAALRVLLQAASDSSHPMYLWSIFALTGFEEHQDEVAPVMEEALQRTERSIRFEAAVTLVLWDRFPAALGAVLREMVAAPEDWARSAGLRGLARVPAEAAPVGALVQAAMSDASQDVRSAANALWSAMNLTKRGRRDD